MRCSVRSRPIRRSSSSFVTVRSIRGSSARPIASASHGMPHSSCVATGAPRWSEIGDAETIDRQVATFRAALRSPSRTDIRDRSRELSKLVLDPLEASLAGVARLLVSPDGELSVIPFGALVDADGKYLVERLEIDGLASGRDLLRFADRASARELPLIVADPAFQSRSGWRRMEATRYRSSSRCRALLTRRRRCEPCCPMRELPQKQPRPKPSSRE